MNLLSPSSALGSLIVTVMGSLLPQSRVRVSGFSPEAAAGVKATVSSCDWTVTAALPRSPRLTAGGAGPSTAAWAKEPPGPWTDSWTDCWAAGVSVLPVQFRLVVST